MKETEEILELLNPWWKDNNINKKLAKPYKRKTHKKILELHKHRQITLIYGLRRTGKTTLIYQNIEHLLKKHNPKHILYFTFDKKTKELTEILEAYKELTKTNWKKEETHVFLDEITKLDDWANKIKLIYDALPNIKFTISSSSSIGLEEEAIKNLAGRYFPINLKPLNFTEYLELKGKNKYLQNTNLWEKEIKKELNSYLLRSFPETVEWENKLLVKDYLRTTILDKIIKVDLQDKFRNVNRDLLSTLIEIFYSEPGMYLDYDSISKKLRISKKTLTQHIYYLEYSYLLKRIRNFRINTFTTSRKLQKTYAYWWTLAYCYTNNQDRMMENIVASSMDAKYYWRKNNKEIDFLKLDGKKIQPIEVKNKQEVTKNQLRNMKYFLEKYNIKEGQIVYKGIEKTEDEGKIRLQPLWKWMLE